MNTKNKIKKTSKNAIVQCFISAVSAAFGNGQLGSRPSISKNHGTSLMGILGIYISAE